MIVKGLPFADYAALAGVHFSTLKHLDTSPRHYLRAVSHDRADTPALRMGRAVHSLILTPDAADVAVFEGAARRGKAWESFEAANAGKTIVKADEIETARRMRASVMSHPAARHLLSAGDPEVSITWTGVGGIACRARIDWLRPEASGLIELKTTRHIGARAFQREFAQRSYHAQAAFYQDGIVAAQLQEENDGGGDVLVPPVTMVVVENVEPHDVMVWTIPDEVLEVGRRKVDAWLTTVRECTASGRWPGVGGDAGEVGAMVLPDWAATEGLDEPDMGDTSEEDS